MIDQGPREETPVGLAHPEWVNGRRLWLEPSVSELIRKLHEGDPVRAWEGDPRLAIYWNGVDDCWELWRLEADGQYRIIWRGKNGTPLDERLIDMLMAFDRQRQTVPLHDRVVAANERVEADHHQDWHNYVAEEAAPRLAKALKEADHW